MVYGTLSGVWAEMKDEGMPLFSAFKPCMVNKGLRKLLHDVGVQNPESYRSHDLRRGHARDMQDRGHTIGQILAAGQWKSAAFMTYLDEDELAAEAVLEAHLNESSDEDVA